MGSVVEFEVELQTNIVVGTEKIHEVLQTSTVVRTRASWSTLFCSTGFLTTRATSPTVLFTCFTLYVSHLLLAHDNGTFFLKILNSNTYTLHPVSENFIEKKILENTGSKLEL